MEALDLKSTPQTHELLHASLPPSKSEVNRWLILMAQLPELTLKLPENNLAEDNLLMLNALKQIGYHSSSINAQLQLKAPTHFPSDPIQLNIKCCGTCARFLLPLLCTLPGQFILDGDERMRNRPMQPLVDTLVHSGAIIKRLSEQELPLSIDGKKSSVKPDFKIDTKLSSQFLTALLLLAPAWGADTFITETGLGNSSFSNYTLALLRAIGIDWQPTQNTYKLQISDFQVSTTEPEADWASASYWLALSQLTQRAIHFTSLSIDSSQPDALAIELYRELGFKFSATTSSIRVQPPRNLPAKIVFNAAAFPDLVPGFAIWFAIGSSSFVINGLERLTNKESNRLTALQRLFNLMGTALQIHSRADDVSITWTSESLQTPTQNLPTFGDHRLALASSLLVTRFDQITIEAPEVVVKSYPNWWLQLRQNRIIQ